LDIRTIGEGTYDSMPGGDGRMPISEDRRQKILNNGPTKTELAIFPSEFFCELVQRFLVDP